MRGTRSLKWEAEIGCTFSQADAKAWKYRRELQGGQKENSSRLLFEFRKILILNKNTAPPQKFILCSHDEIAIIRSKTSAQHIP